MTSYINTLTDFGDSAVTGTFTVITVIFLLFYKEKRAAWAIAVAFCLAAALIALGKIALYSRCHPQPDAFFDLHSPSGHSAISVAVYGTFATIVSSSQIGWRRIAPYLFVVSLVLLIAASRVVLGYHTATDVIVGSSIGAVVSFFMWLFFLKGKVIRCRWTPFTLVAFIIVMTLNGLHFPAESIIDYLSQYIRIHTRSC